MRIRFRHLILVMATLVTIGGCALFGGSPDRIYLLISSQAHNGDFDTNDDGSARDELDQYMHDEYESYYSDLDLDEVHALVSVNHLDEIRDMPTLYGVPTDVPVFTSGDVKIADDWADLLDGSIDQSLWDAGYQVFQYWTGSYENGALWTNLNCNQFTAADTTHKGVVGYSTEVDALWLNAGSVNSVNSSSTAYLLAVAW